VRIVTKNDDSPLNDRLGRLSRGLLLRAGSWALFVALACDAENSTDKIGNSCREAQLRDRLLYMHKVARESYDVMMQIPAYIANTAKKS